MPMVLACQYGLAAIDALHVAAAFAVGAEELMTTEKPTKPMHRVENISIVAIMALKLAPYQVKNEDMRTIITTVGTLLTTAPQATRRDCSQRRTVPLIFGLC